MAVTATKAATNGKVEASAGPVVLVPLKLETVVIPIVGKTELIVHAFSQKARNAMLLKQMNPGARAKKEAKNPTEDYEACFYRFEDGRYGFPATGFKSAIVGACRLFDGMTMTMAKIAIHVHGEGPEQLVEINGTPYMREDTVRIGSGASKVADIRHRPGFPEWSTDLTITFNASILTLEGLVALIDAAGFGGIGEWRPERSGNFGTFGVGELS